MLARRLVDQQNDELAYWQTVLEEEAKELEEDLLASEAVQIDKKSSVQALWEGRNKEATATKVALDKVLTEEAAIQDIALDKQITSSKDRDDREHARMKILIESQAQKQMTLENQVAFMQDQGQKRVHSIREEQQSESNRLTGLFTGMLHDLDKILEENRKKACESDATHLSNLSDFDKLVSVEQLNIITEATKQIVEKRDSYQPSVQENQVLKRELDEQQATMARLKKEEAGQIKVHAKLKKESTALEQQIVSLKQKIADLDLAILQKEQGIDKANEDYKVQEYHYSLRQEEEQKLDAIVDPKRRFLKDLNDRSEVTILFSLDEKSTSFCSRFFSYRTSRKDC